MSYPFCWWLLVFTPFLFFNFLSKTKKHQRPPKSPSVIFPTCFLSHLRGDVGCWKGVCGKSVLLRTSEFVSMGETFLFSLLLLLGGGGRKGGGEESQVGLLFQFDLLFRSLYLKVNNEAGECSKVPRSCVYNGFSGKAGGGMESRAARASLPPLLYLSVSPSWGSWRRNQAAYWTVAEKKTRRYPGEEVVGGGGRGRAVLGWGWGWGAGAAGISVLRSEPQLQACRRGARSLCTPWEVPSVGEKQPRQTVLSKGEFGK